MVALEVLELATTAATIRVERLGDVVVRHPRRDLGLLVARLVDQRRHGGGQPGGVEPLPHAVAQALGGEQVHLGVEPAQPLARAR